jgi:hypothetical protein
VAKIDRLKGEETECASDVNEVFGGRTRGFRADWLVPTAPVFPPSVRDDIMGYTLSGDLMVRDVEAGDDGYVSGEHPKQESEVRARAPKTPGGPA